MQHITYFEFCGWRHENNGANLPDKNDVVSSNSPGGGTGARGQI